MPTKRVPPEPGRPDDTPKQVAAKKRVWDAYHADERRRGHDLADALCTLSFQGDVRAYLTAKEAIATAADELERTMRNSGTDWRRARVAAVDQSAGEYHRLDQRALLWLQYRYVEIARDAYEQLHMPSTWFRDVVRNISQITPFRLPPSSLYPSLQESQYDNGHDAIRSKIDEIIALGFYEREHGQPVGATLFRTIEDAADYLRMWQQCRNPSHLLSQHDERELRGVVLPWPDGMPRDLYKVMVCRTIDILWPEIGSERLEAPKNPGERAAVKPKGGGEGHPPYTRRAGLCNLWLEHPMKWDERPDLAHLWADPARPDKRPDWAGFARLATARGLYTPDPKNQKKTPGNAVKAATHKALRWGLPTAGVATSLDAFSLTDPVPPKVASFMEASEASTRV